MRNTPTRRRTALEDRLGARFVATASADLNHALASHWQIRAAAYGREAGEFVGETTWKLDSWLTLS